MKAPRRPLSEEEIRLWNHVTQHDAKLHTTRAEMPPRPQEKKPIIPVHQLPGYSFPASAHAPDLSCGAYAGIDRNTAERFRKGQYPIDATLDLHGMSREKAHLRLSGFLHNHYVQ